MNRRTHGHLHERQTRLDKLGHHKSIDAKQGAGRTSRAMVAHQWHCLHGGSKRQRGIVEDRVDSADVHPTIASNETSWHG